jgi:hypothetical protein
MTSKLDFTHFSNVEITVYENLVDRATYAARRNCENGKITLAQFAEIEAKAQQDAYNSITSKESFKRKVFHATK